MPNHIQHLLLLHSAAKAVIHLQIPALATSPMHTKYTNFVKKKKARTDTLGGLHGGLGAVGVDVDVHAAIPLEGELWRASLLEATP